MHDKINQISEMTEVMQKSIEIDEKNANSYEERLAMLEIENQGLKELLKIKNTYAVNTGNDD